MNNIDIRPFTRQFYRGNGIYLFLAGVETILMVAAELMISWLLMQVTDLISGANTTYTLTQLVILFFIAFMMFMLHYVLLYHSNPRFTSKAIAQYKEYVFSKLTQKSVGAFASESTATYLSALSNDAAAIETGYLSGIFGVIHMCLLAVGSLVLMCWYSPLLTLVAIALSLLPLIVSLLVGNRVAVAQKVVSDRNESFISTLRDSLDGFPVIKSFKAEGRITALFRDTLRLVTDAKERSGKASTVVTMLAVAAGLITQFGVFIVGAYLAGKGSALTAGVLVMFVNAMNSIISPIRALPPFFAQRKAAKAMIYKAASALEQNVRDEGSVEIEDLHDGITLDALNFSYEEGKPILRDVNTTFKAGKRYAVVGQSGSGKSTLLNLITAAGQGYTGAIRYDGTELRDISSESLYDLVSVIHQNVFIFNASIRDNITMFSEFPQEEVDRAISLSGLSALISEKGEGYLCGENGANLSGGEKQRISIARSLLKKTRVLLVDEATASLDAATAFQVSNALLDLEDMTVIVVTHALDEAILSRYDGILALKNGAVAETGTFSELMDKKGYFYSLYTVSQ